MTSSNSLYVEPGGELSPSQLVARRIRGLLAERQIVGQQVADALQMPQPSFSRRYRGTTPWTIDELYVLADVLAMDLSDLLPRLDSNQRPFVSQSPQVSAVLTLPLTLPLTPVPAVSTTVPQPQATTTTTTKKATAPVGGAVVVDLVTYRAGRRAGTRRATTRRPA